MGIIEAIWVFPVNENDLLRYTSRKIKDIMMHRVKLNNVGTKETWKVPCELNKSRILLLSVISFIFGIEVIVF